MERYWCQFDQCPTCLNSFVPNINQKFKKHQNLNVATLVSRSANEIFPHCGQSDRY
jgi:hypothetical protein